jgi:hypothetical protein
MRNSFIPTKFHSSLYNPNHNAAVKEPMTIAQPPAPPIGNLSAAFPGIVVVPEFTEEEEESPYGTVPFKTRVSVPLTFATAATLLLLATLLMKS